MKIQLIDRLINRKFKIHLVITSIIGLIVGFMYYYLPFDVLLDGQVVGTLTVNDKNFIENHIDELKSNYNDLVKKEIEVKNNIKFVKAFYFKKTNSKELLTNEIINNLEFYITAYSININNKDVLYLLDKDSCINTIEKIKNVYNKNNNEDIIEVNIVEKVNILEKKVSIYDIITSQSAFKYLITGNEAFKKSIIENNDYEIEKYIRNDNDDNILNLRNLYIASRNKFNNKISEYEENSSIDNKNDKFIDNKPLINIEIKRKLTDNEEIDFKTIYKKSSELNKGSTKVVTKGIKGIKEVSYNVTLLNGIEINREKLNERVIKKPQNKIVLQGTKSSTSIFIKPTTGIITSKFGPRNGGFHRGVDIASKIGTPVYAANSGVVIFAGYSGNYGKLIKIDHGNGYITYYAHNSELLVNSGDKVNKGQLISKMGATGKVTGPHLHFEVIKNGKNLNPLNFIKY